MLVSVNKQTCLLEFIFHNYDTMSVNFMSLDMAAERNALMERIYPKLKAFAQEKGYEFQVGLLLSLSLVIQTILMFFSKVYDSSSTCPPLFFLSIKVSSLHNTTVTRALREKF